MTERQRRIVIALLMIATASTAAYWVANYMASGY